MSTALDRLAELRVVPVVEIEDAGTAVPLARALRDAGLPALEVTLRTGAAVEAVRRIAAELPEVLVGAGTLLTADQVAVAAGAGARFGVSPGFTPALSAAAADAGLPFVPGTVTAGEVLAAVDAGHRRLKFFPAEQAGGAPAIRSLTTPFAALGVTFMPTGGLTPDNAGAYLALPSVFAIGGTWIAPRRTVAEQAFDAVGAAAREALRLTTAGAAR